MTAWIMYNGKNNAGQTRSCRDFGWHRLLRWYAVRRVFSNLVQRLFDVVDYVVCGLDAHR